MQNIKTFPINHQILKKGIYIKSIHRDVTTYDIRTITPNTGMFMDYDTIHTIVHLFGAFAAESSYAEHIVHFGPIASRTGFYLLARDPMTPEDVVALSLAAFEHIATFVGKITDDDPFKCGNFREHNLLGAILIAKDMLKLLPGWTAAQMIYPE